MLGKPIVYLLVVILIAYEYNVYLGPGEITEVVNTLSGKLQGNIQVSRGGRKFASFYGIPYAKPPVGNLRFAAPQPAEKWNDVKVADNDGIECISYEYILDLGVVGQEDCLVLNVFTTNDLKELNQGSTPKELYPVIVYIHGGGFLSGSAKPFRADYFMDRNVVVVTMNYRLGALGFLNTGDNAVRGNMGLKDQNLALKWIHDNIKSFGGNPDKVTIMGESAGAVSVHLHTLSPLSAGKGLFQQAIMLSGHALVPWAIVQDPVQQAQRFGENVSCLAMTQSEFLRCMRSLKAEDVVKIHAVHRNAVVHPLENFGPSLESIVDGDTFLSRSPTEILNSGNYTKVPIFAGVNEGEGLLWVARTVLDIPESQRIRNIAGWYNALPNFLYSDDLPQENLRKITKFYFGTDSDDFDPLEQYENFTNLFSDRVFNTGLIKLAELHKKQNPKAVTFPMYLYYYTYRSTYGLVDIALSVPTDRTLPSVAHAAFWIIVQYLKNTIFGYQPTTRPASHADELSLLFNMHPILNVGLDSRDYPMSEALVEAMYRFAAHGGNSMDFKGHAWQPVGSDLQSSIKLMRLDDKCNMIDVPFMDRINFWKSMKI